MNGLGIQESFGSKIGEAKQRGRLGFQGIENLNVELLSWRVLNEHTLLVARIFWNNYFNKSQILQAKLGSSPQYYGDACRDPIKNIWAQVDFKLTNVVFFNQKNVKLIFMDKFGCKYFIGAL